MKFVATRKLFLANGVAVKIGDPVPGYDQWSDAEKNAHLAQGLIQPSGGRNQALAGRTSSYPASVSMQVNGPRKAASPVKRKG